MAISCSIKMESMNLRRMPPPPVAENSVTKGEDEAVFD